MSTITFANATRHYDGVDRPAVDGLNLSITDGEFLVLVGPSGCGKSTSLRMLAGLEEVDTGHILIGERDVTSLPPKSRDIAMVFQNYALYPHMTVSANMGFALRIAGLPKHQIAERVQEAARVLDLEDYLERKPKALSGGQRQRVAMGRAIVRQPQAFLMDEPLSNLDAKLRVSTRTQIAALQRRLGTTTVYVTHDQVEAMTMGDRIAVMSQGVLQQCDTPRAVYDRPANAFVAGFIGSPSMNLCPLELTNGSTQLSGWQIDVPREVVADADGPAVTIGFRPEALSIAGPSEEGITVTVTVVEELGADAFAYCTLPGHDATQGKVDIIAKVDARTPPLPGSTVKLRARPDQLHYFSAQTGERLACGTA